MKYDAVIDELGKAELELAAERELERALELHRRNANDIRRLRTAAERGEEVDIRQTLLTVENRSAQAITHGSKCS